MRGLREELKAYQAGAKMTMAIEGKRAITEYDIQEMLQNSQLLVEFIRLAVNGRDTDPFRTTPVLVAQFTGAGITYDHILHGRINVDTALAQLHSLSAEAPKQ
jgi:hypothetical protein